MKPHTREWLAKAEADYRSMLWEMRAPRARNYDAVCFFAQQCAEKYLKACLQESSIPFPRTHDLEDLLQMCLNIHQSLEELHADLGVLTDYAVDFRYPGMSASAKQAADAVRKCEKVRSRFRRSLKLVVRTQQTKKRLGRRGIRSD